MNIDIVDDNLSAIVKLRDYLGAFFNGSLINTDIKTYMSGEDFLQNGELKKCDVVFLDIFMQQINGIDVARRIRQENNKCLIIFVTSSNNFAAESYDVGAIAYLTKPYEYDKFVAVMQKIDERVKKNSCYFDIKAGGELKRIVVSGINFVDYFNHYVQIHTDGELIKSYTITFVDISKTLSKYNNFMLCYRNVIINMDKVSKVEGKFFVMQNGETAPINRDNSKEIKENYHTYLFKKIEGGM